MKEGVSSMDIKVILIATVSTAHGVYNVLQEWLRRVENIDPTHHMVFKLKVNIIIILYMSYV